MMRECMKFILVILFFISIAYAQTTKIDSLETLLLNHPENDTVKVNLLLELSYLLSRIEMDTGLQYAISADSLSEILNYQKGKAKSLKTIGIYYRNNSDYLRALDYYKRALKISEEIDDKLTIAACYNNIGNIYLAQSNYPRALENLQKSLLIFEKIGREDYSAVTQMNIAMTLGKLNKKGEQQAYNLKAADYFEKKGYYLNLITAYQNIVSNYIVQKKDSLALHYSEKLVPLCKKMNDNKKLILALINIGLIQESFGNIELAKKNYLEAISRSEESKYLYGSYSAHYSIANLYYKNGDYNSAIDNALVANTKANKLGKLEDIAIMNELLAKIYKGKSLYKKAFEHYVIFKTTTDSILNESNIKEITNLENQYQFEKEKEAIAAEQAKKDAILAEEMKRQKVVRNSFIAGFLIVMFFAIIIFRNLAQKRKANRKLAKQKAEIEKQAVELKVTHEKLLELDQLKQNLTSMIVHDLKNPLNGIIHVSNSYSAENQVRQMKQIGKQMLNMVLNILDVNKYEDTQMTVDKIAVSLFGISQKAVNSVLFLSEQKNITITNDIDSTFKVYADSEIIERVFLNLLTNAIKFTPNNGNIILSAALEKKKDMIKVSVTDTGSGIPPNKIHLVFVKFGQIAEKKSGGVRSTGLGLTFCKMAVEAHGGEIDIESEINKGSTFWFTLQSAQHEIIEEEKESPLLADQEKYSLTSEEKKLLIPVIYKLEKIEIYKMMELRKILRQIDEDSENIKEWKKDIQQAIRSANEEKYKELLKYCYEAS